jgi:hypothetical protein
VNRPRFFRSWSSATGEQVTHWSYPGHFAKWNLVESFTFFKFFRRTNSITTTTALQPDLNLEGQLHAPYIYLETAHRLNRLEALVFGHGVCNRISSYQRYLTTPKLDLRYESLSLKQDLSVVVLGAGTGKCPPSSLINIYCMLAIFVL